mgnify:CR=1 FL=1
MVFVLKRNAGKKEVEARKKQIEKIKPSGVNTKKYCGVIKLKKDPLIIQKEMRDEWQ